MILKGIGLLGCGLVFIWLGILGWMRRSEERISLIEAAILKMGDAEPLPFNRWDRAIGYVQPVLMLLFGPAMTILGILLLIS